MSYVRWKGRVEVREQLFNGKETRQTGPVGTTKWVFAHKVRRKATRSLFSWAVNPMEKRAS